MARPAEVHDDLAVGESRGKAPRGLLREGCLPDAPLAGQPVNRDALAGQKGGLDELKLLHATREVVRWLDPWRRKVSFRASLPTNYPRGGASSTGDHEPTADGEGPLVIQELDHTHATTAYPGEMQALS